MCTCEKPIWRILTWNWLQNLCKCIKQNFREINIKNYTPWKRFHETFSSLGKIPFFPWKSYLKKLSFRAFSKLVHSSDVSTYIVKFYDTIRTLWFGPLNFYVVHIADIVEFTFSNYIRGWATFPIFSGAFDYFRRLTTVHCVTITCIHGKCVFCGWFQISPKISRVFTDGLIHHRLKTKKRASKCKIHDSDFEKEDEATATAKKKSFEVVDPVVGSYFVLTFLVSKRVSYFLARFSWLKEYTRTGEKDVETALGLSPSLKSVSAWQ